MPIYEGDSCCGAISAADQEKLAALPKLHFGAFCADTIPVSNDRNNPTRFGGAIELTKVATSSPEFEFYNAVDGAQWVKNNSTKTVNMAGSVSYQLDNGTGGAANIKLWTEISEDDGLTFTEAAVSLRTSTIANTSASSQTKASAIDSFAPGQSIRWAFFNSESSTLTLAPPSELVNGGNTVAGLSFFWELLEP